MSSNRLIYDECEYKKKLQDSTSPLSYSLYTGKYENCAKCRIELGVVGGNGVSIFNGNLVDLESELRGQFRLNSKCPSNMYSPNCGPENKSTLKNTPRDCIDKNLKHQAACQMHYYPRVPTMELPKPSTC